MGTVIKGAFYGKYRRIVVLCWLVAVIAGLIAAFLYGIIGLIAFIGVGFLFVRVIKDRLENKEDDYYSKHVDK